jgi:hypothetical protein
VTKGHWTDVSFELGRGVERFVGVEAEEWGKKSPGICGDLRGFRHKCAKSPHITLENSRNGDAEVEEFCRKLGIEKK